MALYFSTFLLAVAAASLFSPAVISLTWLPAVPVISIESLRGFILNAATAGVATAFTIRAARNMSSAVRRDLAQRADAGVAPPLYIGCDSAEDLENVPHGACDRLVADGSGRADAVGAIH